MKPEIVVPISIATVALVFVVSVFSAIHFQQERSAKLVSLCIERGGTPLDLQGGAFTCVKGRAE